MEAGKARLKGEETWGATKGEVDRYQQENEKSVLKLPKERTRYQRTAKEKLTRVLYTLPSELQKALDGFRHWYNHEHYHEALGNLHPADVYEDRAEAIIEQRKRLPIQTKKTRRRVNLRTIQNPRKIRNLRLQTPP